MIYIAILEQSPNQSLHEFEVETNSIPLALVVADFHMTCENVTNYNVITAKEIKLC